MSDYRHLSVDPVVLVDCEVVLIERDDEPEEGSWVLPGGMVEVDETAAEAAAREAREEVGLDVEVESFLGLFDSVDRDPRGNVSAAYVCRAEGQPEPLEEAARVGTYPLDDLPEPLGFDHRDILEEAERQR